MAVPSVMPPPQHRSFFVQTYSRPPLLWTNSDAAVVTTSSIGPPSRLLPEGWAVSTSPSDAPATRQVGCRSRNPDDPLLGRQEVTAREDKLALAQPYRSMSAERPCPMPNARLSMGAVVVVTPSLSRRPERRARPRRFAYPCKSVLPVRAVCDGRTGANVACGLRPGVQPPNPASTSFATAFSQLSPVSPA